MNVIKIINIFGAPLVMGTRSKLTPPNFSTHVYVVTQKSAILLEMLLLFS